MSIESKFSKLGTDNAPGQELRQSANGAAGFLTGDMLTGRAVDFSHGDVDAHEPTPGAAQIFAEGVAKGAAQAYTEYRGDIGIRQQVAADLADFTGAPVDAQAGMIVTPGTQGALFLAVAANMVRGDKVAILQPDYFANRKLVEFFEGQVMPVQLRWRDAAPGQAGIDLDQLEAAFRDGARLLVFSNPNNPTGVVFSAAEIAAIVELANRYEATVIVDQLYSRLRYGGTIYTHLRAQGIADDRVITIMGPSKTESLSGYRLGVAFGAPAIITRMEKLQAIVSLRAGGYSQAVLRTWFHEPVGWMADRVAQHQAIRDDLVTLLTAMPDGHVRTPDAGSYVFPTLPALTITPGQFVTALRQQAGVTVTPGTEFSPHTADSVRLNFSQDHTAAVAAVQRLIALVERYRA